MHKELSDFKHFIENWQKPIYNLAYRNLGNEPDAMDATQNVFMAILKYRESCDEGKEIKPWVFRIAVNEIIGISKRRQTFPKTDGTAGMRMMEDNKTNKEDARQIETALQNQLNLLPEEDRALLTLHYLQGLSIEDAAEIQGISRATAYRKIGDSLGKMKVGLTACGMAAMIPTLESALQGLHVFSVPAKLSASLGTLAATATTATATATSGAIMGGFVMTNKIIATMTLTSLITLGVGFGIGRNTSTPASPADSMMLEDGNAGEREKELRDNILSLEEQISSMKKDLAHAKPEAKELAKTIQEKEEQIGRLKSDLESRDSKIKELMAAAGTKTDKPLAKKLDAKDVESMLAAAIDILKEMNKPGANRFALGPKLVIELGKLSETEYAGIMEFDLDCKDAELQSQIAEVMVNALSFNSNKIGNLRQPYLERMLGRLEKQNGYNEAFRMNALAAVSVSAPPYFDAYDSLINPLDDELKNGYLDYALEAAEKSENDNERWGAVNFLSRNLNPKSTKMLASIIEDKETPAWLLKHSVNGMGYRNDTETLTYLENLGNLKVFKENADLSKTLGLSIESVKKNIDKLKNNK